MLAVPAPVLLRVAQAEVGGQVDDGRAALAELGDDRRRGAVRIGDDRGVDALERLEVELAERQRHPVARVDLVEPRSRPRCAR